MTMKPRALALVCAAALAALICGCSTLSNLTTPAANPLIQVAVDVAVAQVVGTGASAHAQAQKISSIAQQALALDNGSSVAITAIESAVNAQIAKLNLPPADALAANVLVQTVETLITQKLGGGSTTTTAGTVTSTTNVAIALVLNDVIQACAIY
jgi:hypothetical protein